MVRLIALINNCYLEITMEYANGSVKAECECAIYVQLLSNEGIKCTYIEPFFVSFDYYTTRRMRSFSRIYDTAVIARIAISRSIARLARY